MLDIVIVNWNAGPQLKTCIDSINTFGGGIVKRIIVVDNGSVDGSDTLVEAEPNVTLIRSGANLGFGKACNLGAQRADSDYLLFLNPDAALFEETLANVVNFMQDPANQRVGICGVQLINESGQVARHCARFPSITGFVAHAIGLDRLFPSLGHFMAEWDHLTCRQVDHVIGAFFFVRRSLFEQLNGFDERFFVYLEDLDFSYRAHQAGWKSFYLADAQAFHAGGGTSRQVKMMRLFYSLRSRLLYGFKHFSLWRAWLLALVTCAVEPFMRITYCIISRDWAGIRNTLQAYRKLLGALPQIAQGHGRDVDQ